MSLENTLFCLMGLYVKRVDYKINPEDDLVAILDAALEYWRLRTQAYAYVHNVSGCKWDDVHGWQCNCLEEAEHD